MEQPFPKYALFSGKLYTFVRATLSLSCARCCSHPSRMLKNKPSKATTAASTAPQYPSVSR